MALDYLSSKYQEFFISRATELFRVNSRLAVRFSVARAAFLVVLFAFAAGFFAFAAFDPEFFAGLAGSRSRRNFLPLIEAFSVRGVNVVLLSLVAYLVWDLSKYARQLMSRTAVWIEGDTIRFHPSVSQASVPLQELDSVSLDERALKATLTFRTRSGKLVKVHTPDRIDARAFVSDWNDGTSLREPAD